MPENPKIYSSDRVLVIQDERERIVELADFNLELPLAGIFDEPRRCYPINKEWAKIVTGAVSLLLEIAVWPDAENEDYSGIQQILEFLKGEDCMDCEDIEDCLETSTTITTINNNVTNINNTINNNNVSIDINTTTVNNVFPPAEQEEIIGGEVPGCDFDAAWSACWTLVNYIDTQNRDFLQEVSQSTSQAKNASIMISAIPALGLLPFDEILAYTDEITNNLLGEYNAIVDTALLQDFACDLFCIAINNDPCGLTFQDLFDYLSGKNELSLGVAIDTLANIVQFALTGTFSGNQYFYYMSYVQVFVAYAGQEFLGLRGVTQYDLQMAAGYNSPDADWELFCEECDPLYYEIVFPFYQQDDCVPPNIMQAGSFVTDAWNGSNLANDRLVYWQIPFGAGMLHDSVDIRYTMQNSAGTNRRLEILGIGSVPLDYPAPLNITTLTIDPPLAGGDVKAVATSNRLAENSQIRVWDLTFKGHGLVPAALVPYMVIGTPE